MGRWACGVVLAPAVALAVALGEALIVLGQSCQRP